MPRSAKDIQLTELKDTILKLNELISAQTKSMDSLNKTIEELRQELSNKQAEVDYLKSKLFGSSSEKLKVPFPGQMNLFEEEQQDDRIPEIIKKDGKTCVCSELSEQDYITMLDQKLNEELAEYHKDQNIEELADLMEVIYAAAIARGYTIEQLEKVRAEKAEKRGAFQKKILLVEVTED